MKAIKNIYIIFETLISIYLVLPLGIFLFYLFTPLSFKEMLKIFKDVYSNIDE